MRTIAQARRTFQPVRRGSVPVGQEAGLWRPQSARQKARAITAAERYERRHKPKGKRNGPLGHVGLEVLRALWSAVRFSDGRLDPSIDWLMRACRRSRDAVVAALARLRDHGFIRWQRRLAYTDGPAGARGPQVRQVSNAYGLDIPPKAAALAPAPPMSDDEITRLRDEAAAYRQWRESEIEDSPLGKALARLGQAVANNASPPSPLNPANPVFSKSATPPAAASKGNGDGLPAA